MSGAPASGRMKKNFRISTAVIAAMLVLFSCSGGKSGKVIPRGKMGKIYAEMFIADQWIMSRNDLGRQPDTSFIYHPIFEKYGFSADDYRASMEYYIQDPERYGRMIKKSSNILDRRLKALKAEKARQEFAAGNYIPPQERRIDRAIVIPRMLWPEAVSKDTLRYFADSIALRIPVDTLRFCDSLSFFYVEPVDTVAAEAADSSKVESVVVLNDDKNNLSGSHVPVERPKAAPERMADVRR